MIKALRSMGYRVMKNGLYGKPVGYGIFLINISTMELSFTFKDKIGKLSTWDRKFLDEMDLLNSLRLAETTCYHPMWECIEGQFQFLTQEELMDMET